MSQLLYELLLLPISASWDLIDFLQTYSTIGKVGVELRDCDGSSGVEDALLLDQ